MYYVKGEVNNKPKDTSDASLLWKRDMPPENPTRYNLTSFAITLNELTPGLKVHTTCCYVSVRVLILLLCLSNCLL